MKNKLGFTLLELLVVVLIIGILAAIALPQYQLARDKAQFANFQIQVKSITTAINNYRLIHNEYPNSFDGLDIDFSSYKPTNLKYNGEDIESCIIFKDSYCCIGKTIANYQTANIFCGRNDYLFAYSLYGNKRYCIAAKENIRAEHLCKGYSRNIMMSNNLITPYGHKTNGGKGYYYYLLD